jgi:hypothetical protein
MAHSCANKRPLSRRLLPVLGAALISITLSVAGLAGLQPSSVPTASADAAQVLPIGYAGVDYYDPSDYFTHCADYTWLQARCYDNPSNPDPPRTQLISDLNFVTSHHLGTTQRVWISLDQLMQWRHGAGFVGFKPDVLKNVDDMLSLYRQYGLSVVLVLYVYDDAQRLNEFRAWALDGNHPSIRRGYLRALRTFLTHLSVDSTDVAAAPIIELANEPYFQFERYFNNPAHLGQFGRCASSGQTDWSCVDEQIIHPWLTDLYRTASRASNRFLYTFSDTGRLFENYAYWIKMYPEDLIDEHLYDSKPWMHASKYAQAQTFTQPWIASEVGCDVGDASCTYDGTVSAPTDTWWLQNLDKDGAQTVLIDSHVTLWQYPSGPNSQAPTLTGKDVAAATQQDLTPTLTAPAQPRKPLTKSSGQAPSQLSRAGHVYNNFDQMAVGPLHLRARSNSFTDAYSVHRMAIENQVAASKPNAVGISVAGGGRSFMGFHPHWGRAGFRVQLRFRIGDDFRVASKGYIVLARVETVSSAKESGAIDLILGARQSLSVAFNQAGRRGHMWDRVSLRRNRWYHVSLQDLPSRGGLTFSVDKQTFRDQRIHSNSDSETAHFIGIGQEFSPPSVAMAGHFYIDNLSAAP